MSLLMYQSDKVEDAYEIGYTGREAYKKRGEQLCK
jgi:hypothetical protein